MGSPKVHALLGKRSKQANGKRFGVYAETRNEVRFATRIRMTEASLFCHEASLFCHVEQGSVATAVETSLGQTVFFRSFDKLRMTGIACFWFFACLTAFS